MSDAGSGTGGPVRASRRPPKPLPVIVLADISGSMRANELEDKIGVLNRSIAAMLSAFASLDSTRGLVNVGVVVFGGESAHLHLPLVPAPEAKWADMVADGRTPMGDAFDVARGLLEDPAIVPERAFEPTLVLVSDGVPTDDWSPALDELLSSRRGAKALRIAIGIGTDRLPDADDVLAKFSSPEIGILRAEQAEQIPGLLHWVTATVTNTLRTGFAAPKLEDLDRL
jgi:uncharacterized protein YegL